MSSFRLYTCCMHYLSIFIFLKPLILCPFPIARLKKIQAEKIFLQTSHLKMFRCHYLLHFYNLRIYTKPKFTQELIFSFTAASPRPWHLESATSFKANASLHLTNYPRWNRYTFKYHRKIFIRFPAFPCEDQDCVNVSIDTTTVTLILEMIHQPVR